MNSAVFATVYCLAWPSLNILQEPVMTTTVKWPEFLKILQCNHPSFSWMWKDLYKNYIMILVLPLPRWLSRVSTLRLYLGTVSLKETSTSHSLVRFNWYSSLPAGHQYWNGITVPQCLLSQAVRSHIETGRSLNQQLNRMLSPPNMFG